MNQGPQQAIDINALPQEVLHEISTHVDFKTLAALSSLNSAWYHLVQERCRSLIEQYFPYLLARRQNEINANAFNVFKAEYCRYKNLFPKIDVSFILDALSGSLNKIEQTTIKDNKITLCALFMSNGHILPNELLEESKTEIIGHALTFAASNGQLLVVKNLLAQAEIAPIDKGRALYEAANEGQLEVVKYLSTLPNITFHEKEQVLYDVVHRHHFKVVKHLLNLAGITSTDKGNVLYYATKADRLEVVKYLSTLAEITSNYKSWALREAAEGGQLEIVKHLATLLDITPENKCEAFKAAVKEGHLEVVRHLSTLPDITSHDKGKVFIAAVKEALWRNQLETVKYLSTLPEIMFRDKVVALYHAATKRDSFQLAKHLLISIVKATKDNCLTYPKRAITAIQALLHSPFLQRHKTALGRLMLATTMGLGLTAKFPLISAGWSIFLGYAAGAMLVSMLLSTLYQRYMERTFINYNTPEKIQAITDASEKQSLKAGVDAKSWRGYVKSFTVYATYCRMSAFNAGKKCALNNASPSLAEIAKLRIS